MRILNVLLPFLLCATVIRAVISQGLKIQTLMHGGEPKVDVVLIVMAVVTVAVLGVVVVRDD